jgi:hypothetical protein
MIWLGELGVSLEPRNPANDTEERWSVAHRRQLKGFLTGNICSFAFQHQSAIGRCDVGIGFLVVDSRRLALSSEDGQGLHFITENLS